MVAEGDPHPDWPESIMFRAPRYIPYQADYSARMYLMGCAVLAADLGTGKTVMSLATSGLAFEQGDLDMVLVVCEPNKLREWKDDFGTFTRIHAEVYHGAKRKKILDKLPQALITTYETCRDDIAVFPPKGSRARKLHPGPLMDALRGKRVLIVYDEVTKLGRRTSNLYKAHEWMGQQLRKAAPLRVIGMSATPMDTDLENIFSELRLIVPEHMPTVAEFERRVVKSRHPVYKTPAYDREGKEWFRSLVEPWILRKRKSDPDVRALFPPKTEKFTRLRMKPDQYRLYRTLADLAVDPDTHERQEVPGLNVLLRQLAGDPWAVLEAARTGDSELAKMVAEEMGAELEKCSSAKAAELITLADLILAQGSKMLVFTFFGNTVLPALKKRLGNRPVYTYTGSMTDAEREHQKMCFKAHSGGAILLASDALARGVNMREVDYIAEYESARTHALREQRFGRGHRLGKVNPLTCITLVLDSTIEGESGISTLMRRNSDQDFILGDEGADGFVTAKDRRALYAESKVKKAG